MKKTLATIASLALILSNVSAATYSGGKTYNNLEDFLEKEGEVCEVATDGCNTIMMNNGKLGASTLMMCYDKHFTYSCIKYKDTLSQFIEGTVYKIENGKDGQQVYFTDNDDVEYSTAVSFGDEIVNEGLGIKVGSQLKVYYSEILEMSPALLVGDKVEIINKYEQYIDQKLLTKYSTHSKLTSKIYNAIKHMDEKKLIKLVENIDKLIENTTYLRIAPEMQMKRITLYTYIKNVIIEEIDSRKNTK